MSQKIRPTLIHQQLRSAIKTKRLIEFTYQELRRIAEPPDYGVLNGMEQLLVYQVAGQSRSMKLPDWRLIRVTEIKQLRILDNQFLGGRLCLPGSARNGISFSFEYRSWLNLDWRASIHTRSHSERKAKPPRPMILLL